MATQKSNLVNRYLLLLLIIIFGIVLIANLIEFFTAFLAALMFYILSKKVMSYLVEKRKWKKGKAACIIIILNFFIILLPIALLGSLLFTKIAPIASNPDIVLVPFKNLATVVHNKFNFDLLKGSSMTEVQKIAATMLSSIINSSLSFFTTIIMMYFFLYFLLTNFNVLEKGIKDFLPVKNDIFNLFGNELVAQTFSNAIGIPLIALIHGLLAYIAYTIAGVSEAGFWGIITGFASVIPLVGTAIIWLPIGVYLLSGNHTWQGIFVLAWGILIIGLSDNIIRFLLAKKMADVHPIVTVLGVIIGLKFFGLTGLIFGPIMISYFIILVKVYHSEFVQLASITENES